MSRKKKDYGIKVKQPKERMVYGCSEPGVVSGWTKCDGDCSNCKYQYIAETYKVYK